MSESSYDAIIVGSGAGGAATAYSLVEAGRRVLLLEKGKQLPRDGSTLDVKAVFKEGRFKNREPWHDGQGKSFVPGEFYNVGGKTKWYGAALLRFSDHEFAADADFKCLPFPFGLDELSPYYDTAERLLAVNHFPNEPELQALADRICKSDTGWHQGSLPLGLKREILQDEAEAKHFDGFASAAGYKSDAEVNLIRHLEDRPNFTLMTKKKVIGLRHPDGRPEHVTGVVCLDGTAYEAPVVVLAAGALTSPRILQDHMAVTGLGDRLPCAGAVGGNFKLHLNSALIGLSPFRNDDVLRKTAIFFNEAFPHSTVQCLGWMDGEILATQLPSAVPQLLSNIAGARAYGFFVTTEDGSDPDNKVISGHGETPTLDYNLDRIPASRAEHEAVIDSFKRRLLGAGMASADRYTGLAGTAHALGSMVMGTDPATSVVGADSRVHGMEGLFVGDGSVLPRSSRVNPALTIYALGLRLGERLSARLS